MAAIAHPARPTPTAHRRRPAGRSATHAPGAVRVAARTAGPPTAAVYRRRRLLALCALLLLTALAWVTVGAALGLHSGGPAGTLPAERVGQRAVVVGPGDTLWSIARAEAPAAHDVRAYVDRLAELNGGAALQVGQRVVLP